MAGVYEVKSKPKTGVPTQTQEHFSLKTGFVQADPRLVQASLSDTVRHARVIGVGQQHDVVEEQGQFYVVVKGTGQPVSKPTRGAFIAFGQLKELEGGRSATPVAGPVPQPTQQHTAPGESEKDTEKEKEKKAEDKLDDLCRGSKKEQS